MDVIPLPKRLLGVSLSLFGGLTIAGLLALVLGERGFYHNSEARMMFDILGVALLVGVGALRTVNVINASGERRRAELIPMGCHVGLLVSLVIYLLTTKTGMGWLGYTDLTTKSAQKTSTILQVAWAVLALVSAVPLLMSDFAVGVRRFGAEGGGAEYVRTREVAISGLSIGLAAAFLVVTCNVANERNIRRDVSYFKTSEPGESTAAIVMNTSKPIRALLFFPEVNEVKREVKDYFEALSAKTGGKLSVEVHDVEVEKTLAEHYHVTKNGTILLTLATAEDDKVEKPTKPPKTVSFDVDTDLEKARRGKTGKLRTLDREVNTQLLKLMREKLKVYMTVGHGEMNDPDTAPKGIPPRGTQLMRLVLGQDQYELTNLDWTTLIHGVPEDASAVFVLGPSTPLRTEELESLDKYVGKGGHLLYALDPRGNNELGPLEGRLGVGMAQGILADDKDYYDQHHGAFDHLFPTTSNFTSHASTTSLSRMSTSAKILLIEAGALVDKPFTSSGDQPKRSPVIRSMSNAWLDLNNNLTFDSGSEKRDAYVVAEAIEGPKTTGDDGKEKDGFRALVVSDVDMFRDLQSNMGALMPSFGFIEDATKWLAGESVIAGEIVSEDDVPIQHTRSQDQIWFYVTIVGVPLVVLGVGLLLTLRRRVAPAQPRKVAS
jgi:hypothetical protein